MIGGRPILDPAWFEGVAPKSCFFVGDDIGAGHTLCSLSVLAYVCVYFIVGLCFCIRICVLDFNRLWCHMILRCLYEAQVMPLGF